MKQTQEKEKSSLGHKILTGIGIILCVILIPILVINCTLIIKSYTNKDQVPTISGIFPMIILTDSMYPEFESGDLIICNTAEPEDIKVGDVICFYDPEGNGTTTVTHRVQDVVTDDEGNLAWITKGDANNTEDLPTVPAKNLIGVYKTRLKGLGNVAMFMQTTQGLIICVICPIILLVAYDVIRRQAYEKSKKKDTDALLAELEALRAEKEKDNKKDI
nr:signal peptidase I [uncultured Blautia sp.]